jgi:hypothetical protein
MTLFTTSLLLAADTVKGSSSPKVLLGNEGKRIDMLEVNDSKQVIVRFKNIGGQWEGKTFLWSMENSGPEDKDIFFEQKKGSKMQRHSPLLQRSGSWKLFVPEFPGKEISFHYSTLDSEKLQAKELIDSFQNQNK